MGNFNSWKQGSNGEFSQESPYYHGPYQQGGGSNWEFNVPTQNSFSPSEIRMALKGNTIRVAPIHQMMESANPNTTYQPPNGNTPNRGRPSLSGQGSWGFFKPNQGTKRPVERGKEPEGRGMYEQQKRPKM